MKKPDDLDTVLVKTCVTCIKFFNDHLFAGIGGILNVIPIDDSTTSTWKVKESVLVFESQHIHGILPEDDRLLVYGGKQVAVLAFEKCSDSDVNKLAVLIKWTASDWILDAVCSNSVSDVAFLTANNALLQYSSTGNVYEKSAQTTCEERSILYSGKIVNSAWSDLIVLAGTVFSEIVIWENRSDDTAPVLQRLTGHNGVIFSINFRDNLICSTSDDRTVRLWKVEFRENWAKHEISLLVTMFGHSARVWKSCFLPNRRIASVGEDSTICVWTTSGDLETQRSGHEGGEIRSVDFSEKMNGVVTGGRDGGINWWPVASTMSPVKLPSSPHEWLPKCVSCLANGDIVTMSNKGEFALYYEGNWTSCFHDSTFESYCLFTTSPDKYCLAMASIHGWIQIVEARDSDVTIRCKVRVSTGRIFSIAWVSAIVLVACVKDGNILLLKYKENPYDIFETGNFVLPPCKERWMTCCDVKGHFLLCGDRCGSLHLYSTDETSNKVPTDSRYKIHGFKGVSDVKFLRNGLIMSTGRDGTYKQYFIENNRLILLFSFKMQIQWPSAIVEWEGSSVAIFGFHETYFHVWSVEQRCTLFKIDCGGGHRSWDSCIVDRDEFVFAYIKEKAVYYFRYSLREISVQEVTDGLCPVTLNAACALPLPLRDDEACALFGAEDGTLRLYSLRGNGTICKLGVARSHISSVRALNCLKTEHDGVYAVSGGGRGQLIVWKIVRTEESFALAELATHFVRLNSNVSRMTESVDEPEMRYMDLSSVERSRRLIILGACSDGMLRLFSFIAANRAITLTTSVEFQGCLLKSLVVELAGSNYSLTASTTGLVHLWPLDSPEDDIVPLPLSLCKLGVNACDCLYDESRQRLVIATGCDDASVALNCLEMSGRNAIRICDSWTSFSSHSCQITGLRLFNDKLVCCGLDQRISIFSWALDRDGFLVSQIKHKTSFIPDCHGLLAWNSGPDGLKVLVYGEGIQLFKFCFAEAKKEQLR